LSDTCQQSAIVPREIAGALEGALGIAEAMKEFRKTFPYSNHAQACPGAIPSKASIVLAACSKRRSWN
jgi:hypothetical protein